MTPERSYFEVYAVRYATREARSGEHFYGHDPHDVPMPMDYFVWAAVSEDHTLVIDAGFSAEVAARRGRVHLRCPTDGLGDLGIDSGEVPLVILTHLHYDHVGNLEKFPAATFVVQEEELKFWTGRYAGRPHFRSTVEPEDVLRLVRENFAGRLRFVAGSEEVVPGVEVYRTGGHSRGLQIVRIRTLRGSVVLASDAAHFYANIEQDRPFSIVADLAQMYGAFDLVRSLADSPAHVVPGHDPLVMERFPPAKEGLEGIAIRIAQAERRLAGPLVVSMRPYRADELPLVVGVSGRYPSMHGAPVHIGDPEALGISDLANPEFGDAIDIAEDQLPVFWACGVTPQAVAMKARHPMITHSPGHIFVTDRLHSEYEV